MSNLQEIKNRFLQMLDIVQHAEYEAQGVVDEIDEQLYTDLGEAADDILHKFESCAVVIDNLKAGAKAAKERAQSWTDHRRHMENHVERLTKWVESNLSDLPGEKVETTHYRMSMVKKPPRVEVDAKTFEA